MFRNTKVLTASENIDGGLEQGNALLVQLTGTGTPVATVDFQSTVDGVTYNNTPYIEQASVTAAKSVAQLSSITTATTYIILPPITQFRIAVAWTSGTSLSVVMREINYSRPFDGAFADGEELSFGGVSTLFWETADANANYMALELPAGGAVDVPVFLAGIGLDGVDLGLFNGVTQTSMGIIDADRDTALVMDYSGDDAARIRTLGTTRDLTVAPTGDLTLDPASNTVFANGTGVIFGGHTTLLSTGTPTPGVQILGTGYNDSRLLIARFQNGNGDPQIEFLAGNGGIGELDAVVDNDVLGRLQWLGADDTDLATACADFRVEVNDASPATGDIGVDYVWRQMAGEGDPTAETWRMRADGTFLSAGGDIDLNNTGTLLNVGASGNDWTATGLTISEGSSTEKKITIANTRSASPSEAGLYIQTQHGSSGDPTVNWTNHTGGTPVVWRAGTNTGESDRWTLANSATLGTDDAMRVATDGVTTFDSVGTEFTPDYVCDGCGRAEIEPFECCGTVAWHDDVLALREMKLSQEGIDHMAKLGVFEIDGPEADQPGWMGINYQKGMYFTWAGMWQNRERMDRQYDEIDKRLAKIEQALGV